MPKKSANTDNFSQNIKLYYGAVGVIVLGYLFLAIGGANSLTSLTIGPIVLVAGYLIAMPVALLSGVGKKKESPGSDSGSPQAASPATKSGKKQTS